MPPRSRRSSLQRAPAQRRSGAAARGRFAGAALSHAATAPPREGLSAVRVLMLKVLSIQILSSYCSSSQKGRRTHRHQIDLEQYREDSSNRGDAPPHLYCERLYRLTPLAFVCQHRRGRTLLLNQGISGDQNPPWGEFAVFLFNCSTSTSSQPHTRPISLIVRVLFNTIQALHCLTLHWTRRGRPSTKKAAW